jgi:hypothetical protein
MEQCILTQAPAPRASAGGRCKGWVVDRLYEQRYPRTRLLRMRVPEACDNAKILRQVHSVWHAR